MRFAPGTLIALVVAALLLLLGPTVGAQEPEPETERLFDWPDETVGLLHDFFERVDVEAILTDVRAPRAPELDRDPVTVAIRLGPAWEAPFRYVRGAIVYEPYAGSVRGGRGTLLAGAGNSLDQAVLLSEMYRARGSRARLVRGTLRWPEAVELVGAGELDRVERGDPWLRWIEIASDHWWVEVERDGEWVELDPSFTGSSVGESYGRRRGVAESVPRRERATAMVEVLLAGQPIDRVTIPVAQLVGRPVRLQLHKEVPSPPEPDATLRVGEDAPPPMSLLPASPAAEDDAQPPERDPLATVLPMLPEGAPRLDLTVGAHVSQIVLGSLTDLGQVVLRVSVRAPLGGEQSIGMPWQGGSDGQLLVVVGPGRVSVEELRAVAAPVYRLLVALAEAERAGLDAYEARPQPDEAEAPAAEGIIAGATPSHRAPRVPLPNTVVQDDAEGSEPLHPAEELHVALVRAWLAFEEDALPALGTTYLAAVDRLHPGTRLVRSGVRLVGLSWARPDMIASGRLAVSSSDPVAVGGLDAARRRGLQGAYGLLESALLGHVLNGFADRPPVTAFDITLRSVGSGSRLGWWRRRDPLPDEWSPAGREAAQSILRDGFTIVGPRVPVTRQGQALLGWWALSPASGAMTGMIDSETRIAQGAVDFAVPIDLTVLSTVLAGVRDLHVSAKWLIAAADPESGTLAALMPRACAATSLVGDLLIAGAPRDWQPPLFASYCVASRPAP